jgi:beta-N-acetylhexosaminidase
VISDDLEMKAIADHFGVERGAIAAATAGVDLLLCCHNPAAQHATIDALSREAAANPLLFQQMRESTRRLERLHERFVRP